MELLRDVSSRFRNSNYDIIRNNCNTFSNEVAMLLLGDGIPAHVLGQTTEILSTPTGAALAPLLRTAQLNLMLASNPLFTQDTEQRPLQTRSVTTSQQQQQQ